MQGARSPFGILGAIWGARHRVLSNALARHPDWHVVFYEALCSDPVGEFRRLFQHVGLLWTGAMEKYVVANSATHVAGAYSGRRVSVQQVDKWKREMTPEQVSAVRRYVEPFELPFYRSEGEWSL